MEKDFATNAYWKYFTYDTFDPRTWVTLNDLESCLRTVKGGTVNPWVGADDLWEANVLPLGGHEKMTSQKPGVVFFLGGTKGGVVTVTFPFFSCWEEIGRAHV